MPTDQNLLSQARQYLIANQYEQSANIYQSLIQKDPTNAELYLELSSCQISLGQLDEAIVVIKSGMHFASPSIYKASELQLAQTYQKQGRNADAANLFTKLLNQDPLHLESAIGLSSIHILEGYPNKAVDVLAPLYEKFKNNENFIINYSISLSAARQGEKGLGYLIDCLRKGSKNASIYSNAMLLANYLPTHNLAISEIKRFSKQVFPFHSNNSSRKSINPDGNTPPIRVGFISADFNMHPVGYFIKGLMQELKVLGLKLFAFSNNPKADILTSEIKSSCEEFVQISYLNDQEIKKLVEGCNLDILIDLSGHTKGNRLDLFNQRLCSTQATYLGFMESTGISGMDYIITDKAHAPQSENNLYTEKVIYLPGTRFNFSKPIFDANISDAPFIKNGYITFGCFSNTNKLSDECLQLWGSILMVIPSSRLKLRHQNLSDPKLKSGISESFSKLGIAPGRIEFYPNEKYDSYLNAYSEIDVMLDTLPFTGGTTTCESLWMGVPVLTLKGNFPAARQTASILESINETLWIANSKDQYLDIAKRISNQPAEFVNFRKNCREIIAKSSLGNSKLFAKDFFDCLLEIKNLDSHK